MSDYRPPTRFDVAVRILFPSEPILVNGVEQVSYTDGPRIMCSCRSFGGTESEVNGVYTVIDTMTVETWYHPAITGACRIRMLDDGSVWEILATPENIRRRGQFMLFRVQRYNGKR